jgi:outer membrane protein OmpU
MKKLLSSAALCSLALIATPAQAEDALKLEIGGYFRGYVAFVDQDEEPGEEVNGFDILRDTEVHFNGETTLDNGLTVGFHLENETDGEDGFDVNESYAYFSGGWGRVNFGAEDGVAYLLQVEAPSADDNVDGMRQYIQPVNYGAATSGAGNAAAFATLATGGFEYDNNPTGKSEKITYFTPVLNGFQAGVSFAPDSDGLADDLEGIGTDDVPGDIGHTYEIAVRYEGQFNNVGVIAGGGYTHGELEEDGGGDDDRDTWNLGLDLDIGAFGIGAAYMEDNRAQDVDDEETFVAGADYTVGALKFGASWLNVENTFNQENLDTDRYSVGVIYTYGPGMTVRGSVGHITHDGLTGQVSGDDEIDATYGLLGTQIDF